MDKTANIQLKHEIEELAAEAFHQHLISGYGDGEYPDEYQIVIEGKPRHFPLEAARSLLTRLLRQHRQASLNQLVRSM